MPRSGKSLKESSSAGMFCSLIRVARLGGCRALSMNFMVESDRPARLASSCRDHPIALRRSLSSCPKTRSESASTLVLIESECVGVGD